MFFAAAVFFFKPRLFMAAPCPVHSQIGNGMGCLVCWCVVRPCVNYLLISCLTSECLLSPFLASCCLLLLLLLSCVFLAVCSVCSSVSAIFLVLSFAPGCLSLCIVFNAMKTDKIGWNGTFLFLRLSFLTR